MGGELDTSVEREIVTISLKVLNKYSLDALKMLLDNILNPILNEN